MINKAIIVGRLGKDPDIRSTQSGQKIANLTIATSESWKDKTTGDRKEKTEWHKVSVFNENIASVCEKYLSKGDLVYVEGQIQTRKWEDKDGQEKYTTEIVLQGFGGSLQMLETKKKDESPKRDYKTTPEVSGKIDDMEDNIPF